MITILRLRHLLLGTVCCAPMACLGQQSLFQTSDGQSSLYLQQSTGAINLGDSKASLAFTKHDNEHWIWGYEVFAKASTGVTSLFTSDKAKAPEGGGDFTIGKHFLATSNALQPPLMDLPPLDQQVPGQMYVPKNQAKAREDWALLDIGYAHSSFTVSPTAIAADAPARPSIDSGL